MPILTYTVTGQQITGAQCPAKMASNTAAYVTATFTCDEAWDDCDVIKAVWHNDRGTQIATLLDTAGGCTVPHEVLTPISKVYVNLVGCVYEDTKLVERITTFPKLAIVVTRNAALDGTETPEITQSQFDQYVAIVSDAVSEVTGMRAEAETLPAGSEATAEYRDGVLYLGIPSGGGGGGGDAVWGSITGTLSRQTDLQSALDAKVTAEAGKGLSEENYTAADKAKLAAIPADLKQGHVILTQQGTAMTHRDNLQFIGATITDTATATVISGLKGDKGDDGDDGYSPTVAITTITGGHRITITDKNGAHAYDVMDGEDGVSPTVTTTAITGGTRVTITDKTGSHTFDVMDGADYVLTAADKTEIRDAVYALLTNANGQNF